MEPPKDDPMNRRHFFQSVARITTATVAVPTIGACYGFAASTNLKIDRQTLTLRNLPANFQGMTVAFVTDIHHGPFVSLDYVAGIVRTTMTLNPDLIVLGGDYSHRDSKYIAPCFDILKCLSAPLGVFGVLGNHDYMHGERLTRDGMKKANVTELTNSGVWLARHGERLRLAGVDDLWHGRPDLTKALADTRLTDACVLISHNPDFAETLTDRRVGLVLSGHTHGGQIVLPGYGAPITPSQYGQKYTHGYVEAPATQVYVSAGTGLSILPVRVNCQPEITLITLV